MNTLTKFLIFLSLTLMLATPMLSHAQAWQGLVSCGKGAFNPATNKISDECGFNDLMSLVNKVVNFIFKDLVIPIAAIMFAYAGILLLTAGGEAAGARTKAKGIFINALFGLVISAAAWLIIKTILSILGYDSAWIFAQVQVGLFLM